MGVPYMNSLVNQSNLPCRVLPALVRGRQQIRMMMLCVLLVMLLLVLLPLDLALRGQVEGLVVRVRHVMCRVYLTVFIALG